MRRYPQRRVVHSLLAATMVAGLAVSSLASAAPRKAELESAQQRLQQLEADFSIVVERYNTVHQHLEDIRVKVAQNELEVSRLQGRISAKRAAAVDVAVQLYKSGTAGALEAVLSSESLADMETRLEYLSTTEQAQMLVFEELTAIQNELDQKIAELEADRRRVAADEARLAELRDEINAKMADQKDEVASLRAAIEKAEARRQARLEAERRAAARAAEQRAATRAAAQVAQNGPPSNSGSGGSPPPVSPAPAPNAGAQAAVDTALAQVGDPYQWGAAGPDSFDCSGLTMFSWAAGGVSLPHSSSMQYSATARVSSSALQPGDLMFFGSPIHHVAMYVGNGQMVEAPYTGLSVRVVSAFPLRSDFVGAGRP